MREGGREGGRETNIGSEHITNSPTRNSEGEWGIIIHIQHLRCINIQYIAIGMDINY